MQFKLQLCHDIRGGVIGRRDAKRTYEVSANLIQLWLTQFDRGELNDEEAEASVIAEYEARIAALERKVGQLTMELDLAKKNAAPADRRRQRDRSSSPARGCSVRRGCEVIDLPRSRIVKLTDSWWKSATMGHVRSCP
jgi:transposase-like protein